MNIHKLPRGGSFCDKHGTLKNVMAYILVRWRKWKQNYFSPVGSTSLNITVDWVVYILRRSHFRSWPGEWLSQVRFSWFWLVLPGQFLDDV